MATVTAKVTCTRKDVPTPDSNYANIAFSPNYANGANQEWALATPTLNLTMTVNEAAAAHFHTGKAYTLEFVPEPDPNVDTE